MSSHSPDGSRIPRWVRQLAVAALMLAVLALIVIVAGVGGPHGPGRHSGQGNGGGVNWAPAMLVALALTALATIGRRWFGPAVENIANRVRLIAARPGTRAANEDLTAFPAMGAGLRKLILVVHIVTSVGMLGAVLVFLLLSVVGLAAADTELILAAYLSMDVTARFVIMPLALASLIVGIVQSLGTPWGLFRHWWVVIKLLSTLVVVVVLSLQMDLIAETALQARATTATGSMPLDPRLSLAVHAGGGLVVLLLALVLSVYKPRGLTGWGRRATAPADTSGR